MERNPNWNRAIHVQRFHWDTEGRPVFGAAVSPGERLLRPAGEQEELSLADAVGESPVRATTVAVLEEAKVQVA